MMNHQAALEITHPQSSAITASVILLHGLGADGHDFEPIVQALNLPQVRFILPHAPEMAVTRNNGYIMPAWYDLYGLTPQSQEDEKGILRSQQYLHHLIEQEQARGIAHGRIVLAGFSQGGAVALYTGLRYPKKLGGIIALSTYLPLKSKLAEERHPANTDLPIFMAHGVSDEVIHLETAKVSRDILMNHQYPVQWHEYYMAHSVCMEEIGDIQSFLQTV